MEKIGDCTIYNGDCLEVLRQLPEQSVNCCVTSPPYYGLRDYGVDGQIGLEETPQEYVDKMVAVFREVWRVLRDDGTLWLNLGDSYTARQTNNGGFTATSTLRGYTSENIKGRLAKDNTKPIKINCNLPAKNLLGIPWRIAFALQNDGWILRQDIIWNKPNCMPESVTDRFTKAHEYIFLLSKLPKYYFDGEKVKEPLLHKPHAPKSKKDTGRLTKDGSNKEPEKIWGLSGVKNKRSVWTVKTKPYSGAHFATFPQELIEPCILAGCPEDGIVLDPFGGSGTTGAVAMEHERKSILIELNHEYIPLMRERITKSYNNHQYSLL